MTLKTLFILTLTILIQGTVASSSAVAGMILVSLEEGITTNDWDHGSSVDSNSSPPHPEPGWPEPSPNLDLPCSLPTGGMGHGSVTMAGGAAMAAIPPCCSLKSPDPILLYRTAEGRVWLPPAFSTGVFRPPRSNRL